MQKPFENNGYIYQAVHRALTGEWAGYVRWDNWDDFNKNPFMYGVNGRACSVVNHNDNSPIVPPEWGTEDSLCDTCKSNWFILRYAPKEKTHKHSTNDHARSVETGRENKKWREFLQYQ